MAPVSDQQKLGFTLIRISLSNNILVYKQYKDFPKKTMSDLNAVFESTARYFSVLGEPTRLRILHVICAEELCVSDIIKATGALQANVSRHLGLMYQAGLLSQSRSFWSYVVRFLRRSPAGCLLPMGKSKPPLVYGLEFPYRFTQN